MAASKILLLLAVGLLIGGAAASCGALKESRRASSRGRGAGRSMWALVLVLSGGGLLGASRTALKAVFQAACLTARCSSSTSLGVLYPRAEWSHF